jgi:putative PEP-CTERM system histidine kinase
MMPAVAPVSYTLAAVAFLLAAALVVPTPVERRYKFLVAGACVATAIWAAVIASAETLLPWRATNFLIPVFEQLRSLLWIAVITFILFSAYRKRLEPGIAFGVIATLSAAVLTITGVSIYGIVDGAMSPSLLRVIYTAYVLVAVIGLLLVENLFRNSGSEARWAIKYVCFGTGLLFGYDLIIYAEASLFGQMDPALHGARGIVAALATPFIVLSAVRSKRWPRDLQISRGLVFHSATLVAAGTYLIAIAAIAYSLRIMNGPWGAVSQVSFVAAATLVLAVVLSSGKVQARFKNAIARSLFRYKYDYRQEWLRFIGAVSDNLNDLSSSERIVRAIANIIGSTSGAIWVRDEYSGFMMQSSWNMEDVPRHLSAEDPFVRAFGESGGIWDLKNGTVDGASVPLTAAPQWLVDHPRASFAMPLLHAGKIVGIIVLGELRAPRALDWEDFDLLNTIGRQAASYVAEEDATRSLAIARRFDEFNRRSAFIIHDVKNLAAQMTLILSNAERHGNKPEFQEDMLKTIRSSAERLRLMLEQLKGERVVPVPAVRLDLIQLIRQREEVWKLQIPGLKSDIPPGPLCVTGDSERLTAVFDHVLQNALDAAGPKVEVTIELHLEGVSREGDVDKPDQKSWATVMITDNGPGMDKRFIESQLFQPLVTSKKSGYGIGAFQARQFLRDMGGRLEVDSWVGKGTRITLCLPLAASGVDAKAA